MIVELDNENIKDLNKSNDSFTIFGKLILEYRSNCWEFSEQLFEQPYEYIYPIRDEDYLGFIKAKDKIVYLYYEKSNCIGQIILTKNWNENTFVQDICVKKDYRKKGIGHKLMDQAIGWTKEKNLRGIMLETQDVNLAACRFYKKYGFILGGVDTMLYANFENSDQKALFWYYPVK